jgi:hypothetical protein
MSSAPADYFASFSKRISLAGPFLFGRFYLAVFI